MSEPKRSNIVLDRLNTAPIMDRWESMLRDIVSIDSDKCNGCGKCAKACSEGAIKMIGGKAKLVNEAYCDGLGACLPSCPADAISIVKKESLPFVEPPVIAPINNVPLGGIPLACPGSVGKKVQEEGREGELTQWPVQLRLISPNSPVFKDCDLLIAADCTAFANSSFHDRFIKGRKVIIGCPKLDPVESWNKLQDIINMNDIHSITVTRMDVPCCSMIVNQVSKAVESSGKNVPIKVFTVYSNGRVMESY